MLEFLPLPGKWKFGQYLALLDLSWSEVHPPNGNLVRTWHIGFELVWSLSPPFVRGNFEILSGLDTLDLSWSRVPPPPMEIWSGLGTLELSWSEVPPPHQIWNLVRTWHFGFEFIWVLPPLKMEIWSGLGTLDLSWSWVPQAPPPISYAGAGVWILITVSPMVTASFMICLHVCHTVNYKIELRFIWHYTQRRCFQNGNMKDTFCQSYEVYYFGMQHS